MKFRGITETSRARFFEIFIIEIPRYCLLDPQLRNTQRRTRQQHLSVEEDSLSREQQRSTVDPDTLKQHHITSHGDNGCRPLYSRHNCII